MQTVVGILTFMSNLNKWMKNPIDSQTSYFYIYVMISFNFMLSYIEQTPSFVTLGPNFIGAGASGGASGGPTTNRELLQHLEDQVS